MHNDLSNNAGPSLYGAMTSLIKHLILRDNLVTNSTKDGYNIYIVNAQLVDVYGDHGEILTVNSNIAYHKSTSSTIIETPGKGSENKVNFYPDPTSGLISIVK